MDAKDIRELLATQREQKFRKKSDAMLQAIAIRGEQRRQWSKANRDKQSEIIQKAVTTKKEKGVNISKAVFESKQEKGLALSMEICKEIYDQCWDENRGKNSWKKQICEKYNIGKSKLMFIMKNASSSNQKGYIVSVEEHNNNIKNWKLKYNTWIIEDENGNRQYYDTRKEAAEYFGVTGKVMSNKFEIGCYQNFKLIKPLITTRKIF